jgi:hypothetical protein
MLGGHVVVNHPCLLSSNYFEWCILISLFPFTKSTKCKHNIHNSVVFYHSNALVTVAINFICIYVGVRFILYVLLNHIQQMHCVCS